MILKNLTLEELRHSNRLKADESDRGSKKLIINNNIIIVISKQQSYSYKQGFSLRYYSNLSPIEIFN